MVNQDSISEQGSSTPAPNLVVSIPLGALQNASAPTLEVMQYTVLTACLADSDGTFSVITIFTTLRPISAISLGLLKIERK